MAASHPRRLRPPEKPPTVTSLSRTIRTLTGPGITRASDPGAFRPAHVGRGLLREAQLSSVDDSTSVPADTVAVLSPLNKLVYTFSNAMVGHAARVHAIAGPAVSVCPDTVNAALHELQSALCRQATGSEAESVACTEWRELLALTGWLNGHEVPSAGELVRREGRRSGGGDCRR